MSIPSRLRQQIIQAANYRCEYCRTSSRLTGTPLVMEHILPRLQGGSVMVHVSVISPVGPTVEPTDHEWFSLLRSLSGAFQLRLQQIEAQCASCCRSMATGSS